MSDTPRKISRRDLLKAVLPLGRVSLDKTRCTGCGLCALDCPTEALLLTLDKNGVGFRLLFRHGHCVACSQCVNDCPEKCLEVERALSSERLTGPAEVLFEDELVKCLECGARVGSRAMINSVRAKISAAGRSTGAYCELCPECRARQFMGKKDK